MALRSRLKQGVRRLLGRAGPGAGPATRGDEPGTGPSATPTAGGAGTEEGGRGDGAGRPGASASAAPSPARPAGAAGASTPASAKAGRVDPDKKRMARLKAKKAVLQFLIQQGGTSNMGAMHDFSERRYFVAHKAFSDLMEEFLAEELIDFDEESYQATITAEGRRWVEAATHIKTREKM